MTFKISEALKFGWNTAKSNFHYFLPVLLIIFVATNIANGVSRSSYSGSSSLLGSIVSFLGSFSLSYIALKFVDGKKPTYEDIYRGYTFRKCVNFIAGSILFGIMVALGLILFIIPGLYLAAKYGQFSFGIIDKDLGVLDSFRYSSRITEGQKLHLWGFYLACLGVVVLGCLAFVVGLLWAFPTVIVAGAFVYRRLSK